MMPTATISVLADNLFDIFAAIGDANALPITKPATGAQLPVPPSIVIKVIELIKATKNRDNFTVPREKRG